MNKKIFLLPIFLLAMVFLPAAHASAIHTYVGVQVTSTSTTNTCSATGCTTNSNWCLVGGYNTSYYGTQLTVYGGTTCAVAGGGASTGGSCSVLSVVTGSGTTNPPSPGGNKPICPGSSTILWSGLVDLTASTNYVLKIYTPNYCPGIVFNNSCYVALSANKTCSETCANYGSVPYNSATACYNDAFTSCAVLEGLKGSACLSCNSVASTLYNYWDSSGNCYYTSTAGYAATNGNASSCAAPGAGLTRACYCYMNSTSNNFYFAFTTPSSL